MLLNDQRAISEHAPLLSLEQTAWDAIVQEMETKMMVGPLREWLQYQLSQWVHTLLSQSKVCHLLYFQTPALVGAKLRYLLFQSVGNLLEPHHFRHCLFLSPQTGILKVLAFAK